MNNGELLSRLASTLRREIGPAIEDDYPKTQAFMASVVLQKLGSQIELADAHRIMETADVDQLINDLSNEEQIKPLPGAVSTAITTLVGRRDQAALCAVIESLYAARESLGDTRFDALLGRVRETLRRNIDRQMEYAR